MEKNATDILLKSSSLSVHIDCPGTIYRGSRFDWSAFIRQIEYRGRVLCTNESKVPGQGTGGAGLCSEYGLHHLPAYDSCPVGELFPKIGVGWLRRISDASQSPATVYPIEKAVTITVEQEDAQTVSFFSELPQNGDMACLSTRRITLEDQILLQEVTLENRGKERIETDEYCHNFLSLETISSKEHYDLVIPAADTMLARQGAFHWRDGKIWRTADMKGIIYAQMKPRQHLGGDALWRLVHWPTGLTITDTSQLSTDLIAVWGTDHVISPEVFTTICLEPGESHTFTRRLVFDVA